MTDYFLLKQIERKIESKRKRKARYYRAKREEELIDQEKFFRDRILNMEKRHRFFSRVDPLGKE
jgi:hypothetical protein